MITRISSEANSRLYKASTNSVDVYKRQYEPAFFALQAVAHPAVEYPHCLRQDAHEESEGRYNISEY